jgi:hypothetical protein
MKHAVHEVFDPLWNKKDNMMSRSEAYIWLAYELGIPVEKCHIGMFDVELCRQARQVVLKYKRLNTK